MYNFVTLLTNPQPAAISYRGLTVLLTQLKFGTATFTALCANFKCGPLSADFCRKGSLEIMERRKSQKLEFDGKVCCFDSDSTAFRFS